MSIAVHATCPGRLCDHTLPESDRNLGLAMHLSPLAGLLFAPAILAPLLLWLVNRDKSAFVDDHGRESVNAVLSFVLYHVAAFITVIGIIALPVLYIIAIVSIVRGAVAASRGEFFRYPMTLRFIS